MSEWSKMPAPEGYECVGYSTVFGAGDGYLDVDGEFRIVGAISWRSDTEWLRFVKKWRPKIGEVCYFESEEKYMLYSYGSFSHMTTGGRGFVDKSGIAWYSCRPLSAEEKGE